MKQRELVKGEVRSEGSIAVSPRQAHMHCDEPNHSWLSLELHFLSKGPWKGEGSVCQISDGLERRSLQCLRTEQQASTSGCCNLSGLKVLVYLGDVQHDALPVGPVRSHQLLHVLREGDRQSTSQRDADRQTDRQTIWLYCRVKLCTGWVVCLDRTDNNTNK